MFPLAFALVAALWEGYKAVGPENGGRVLGIGLLPRTGDRAMPHVWKMVSRLGRPEVRGGKETILSVVTSATWYSFRVAFAAFVIGTLLGIGVAVLMARFRLLERALMPYLIVSRYGDQSGAVPQALTDYIKGREGYDYNEHGQAGNVHTQFVPDDIVDRFCIVGPVGDHIERMNALKALGVDQFAIYLQHDDKDHTLQVYGEKVIPAVAETVKAKV